MQIESRSEAHSVNFVEIDYVAALLLAAPDGRRPRADDRRRRRHGARSAAVAPQAARQPRAVARRGGGRVPGLLHAHRRPIPVEPGWVARRSTRALTARYLDLASGDGRDHASSAGCPVGGWSHQVLLVGGLVASRTRHSGIILVGSRLGRVATRGLLVGVVVAVLFGLYRAYTRLTRAAQEPRDAARLHPVARRCRRDHAIWRRRWLAGRGRSCAASTWRCCCRRSATACRPAGC